MEITAGVADGVQSAILEQVTNGVAIRMAVMERALTAESGTPADRLRTGGTEAARMTALAISAQLIDPAAGVEREGRLAEGRARGGDRRQRGS